MTRDERALLVGLAVGLAGMLLVVIVTTARPHRVHVGPAPVVQPVQPVPVPVVPRPWWRPWW